MDILPQNIRREIDFWSMLLAWRIVRDGGKISTHEKRELQEMYDEIGRALNE